MTTIPRSNAFANALARREHRAEQTRKKRLVLTWHLDPTRIAQWTLIPYEVRPAIAAPRRPAKTPVPVIQAQDIEVERQ